MGFTDSEWFRLGGTSRGHLVQAPCNEQGHIPLDQVAENPIQPDLARNGTSTKSLGSGSFWWIDSSSQKK